MRAFVFTLILITLSLAVLGCEREEAISFYQAPKDPPAADQLAHEATPSNLPLTWAVPAGWKEVASSEPMRVATFIVNEEPNVEMKVVPLGAESGALLPNINRWERQLGLPASREEDLAKSVCHEDVNGLHVDRVDLASPETVSPRQRMLAAVVPHGGRVWFFKLSGPHGIVSAQKANFDAFVNSLTPGTSPTTVASASPLRGYKAPSSWREIPNPQPPRVLGFEIGTDQNKAEFAVTRFAPNNSGSFIDNVNRWRRQIELPPIQDPQEVQMQETQVGATGQAVLVEFHNPDRGKRIYVAMATPAGNDLWFFKLSGPADLVASERGNLESFMKSLEFAPEGNGR